MIMGSIDKKPVVSLVASTRLNRIGISEYLSNTGNEDFEQTIDEALSNGLSDMEVLVSLMAKLCYKSLTIGKNSNITRVRDIQSNIQAAIESEHGSVAEHSSVSFIVRDCSRIFTHELVRHRAGTAFSQNSGRYIRLDSIDLVIDPILKPVEQDLEEIVEFLERKYGEMSEKLGMNIEGLNFNKKKKLTSALRRIAPNGQTNEIGFSINLRALRFVIKKRTDRAAEWEIRYVFSQVYKLMKTAIPTLFCDATEELVDGLPEVKFKYTT